MNAESLRSKDSSKNTKPTTLALQRTPLGQNQALWLLPLLSTFLQIFCTRFLIVAGNKQVNRIVEITASKDRWINIYECVQICLYTQILINLPGSRFNQKALIFLS